MASDKQMIYAKKWFNRGKNENDPFDKFIYLWFSLVIVAQYYRTRYGTPDIDNDTDREKISFLFRTNPQKIFDALKKNEAFLEKLALRRGTTFRNVIVDTGNFKLREKIVKLAEYLKRRPLLRNDEMNESLGELLNIIRNNLFHGVKVYDDRTDIELSNLVNPLVTDITFNLIEEK